LLWLSGRDSVQPRLADRRVGGGNAPRPAHRGCIRMTVLGAIVRVMRTVPPPPDRPFEPPRMVWLYESDGWQQVEEPIRDREDGDVDQERADAGYCGHDGKQRQPALEVTYSGPDTSQEESGLRMWVRDEHPQCLITVEWSLGEIRSVYAARFPDGLDLMAKWAPIFRVGAAPSPPTR
jgi:hypothetical protein